MKNLHIIIPKCVVMLKRERLILAPMNFYIIFTPVFITNSFAVENVESCTADPTVTLFIAPVTPRHNPKMPLVL